MSKDETSGWDWSAFILGPFWYLTNGMTSKGIWLLVLCVGTLLSAAPFVWIYCGARGKGDLYECKLKQKSKINLDHL